MKTFSKLIITVISIGALFFVIQLVDWVAIFNPQKISKTTEEKLGELYWDIISKMEKEVKNDSITIPIQKLFKEIAEKNELDISELKIHILQNNEINAFALPGNRIIIYTGLIQESENQGELAGVICHELAHIQKKHIMKKLVKEIGLSTIISMTTGNGAGTETIKQALKILSSSAYDRNLETEADLTAIEYLENAKMSPEYFADFMFKMSELIQVAKELMIISSHPHSEDRTKALLVNSTIKKEKHRDILTTNEWDSLKKHLNE